MIECIFTVDYEIFGDGTGSLRDLVYEPAKRLRDIFEKWDARFVNFVEVAEFEKIGRYGTDPAIGLVKQQIRELYERGFEIGLHLHPQWCNARYESGRWLLDYSEYNLCKLPRLRIVEIVERGLSYLRDAVGQPCFTPLSFRAGNWLFQPTRTAANVLAEKGIKIDSSVFKGGLQHSYNLDYRRALKNGYYWPFSTDANKPDPCGEWIEVPIYTEMVPLWKMATAKRMGFSKNGGLVGQSTRRRVNRALDFLRFRYPLKFDFCRMTLEEMISMTERVIREDAKTPTLYRPLVAIGHTKDLTDFQSVDAFLAFLRSRGISVRTFSDIYSKLASGKTRAGVPAGLSEYHPGIRRQSKIVGDVSMASYDKSATLPAYVLITPARNEADYIELTLKSVVSQTVRPLKWLIVSDGSTDGMDEIVSRYAAEHSWIELIRMPERRERHFGGKANAFNAGYAKVKNLPFQIVGNLDADVSFDAEYFEFLLSKFLGNDRLGVAGTPFKEGSLQYDYRFTSTEHVSGQVQVFRRKCFEDIGGYVPRKTGGIDLVAVITARMKGWETRTFLEKTYEHHRTMSSAKHGALYIAFDFGRTDYTYGCDPLWEICRSIYQMSRPPFLVGGVLCMAGYFWAMVTRAEKVVSNEFIQFRKAEQTRRLRDFFKKVITWPSRGLAS